MKSLEPIHNLDVKSINEKELFYLPSIFNRNIELFGKFGEYSLAGKPFFNFTVELTPNPFIDQIHYLNSNSRHAVANSLVKQAQDKNRNFTYYVHWAKIRHRFVMKRLAKKREYSINVNFDVNATNQQIVKAYFFGLKLDEILNRKLDEKLGESTRQSFSLLTEEQFKIRTQCLNEAIFEAEEYFELFDFDKFFKTIDENKWKLKTLYIDKGTNRYKTE